MIVELKHYAKVYQPFLDHVKKCEESGIYTPYYHSSIEQYNQSSQSLYIHYKQSTEITIMGTSENLQSEEAPDS